MAHNKALANSSSIYKSPHWWIGFFMVMISQPLYIASQAMANQSTLGVVGPTSIIVHVIFARFYLNEIMKTCDILGIFLFVPGTIVTLIFASKSNDLLNREEFEDRFFDFWAQFYLWANVVTCIILYALSYKILKETSLYEKELESERSSQHGDSQTGRRRQSDDEAKMALLDYEKPEKTRRRTSMNKQDSEEERVRHADESDEEMVPDCCHGRKSAPDMNEHGDVQPRKKRSIFSHHKLRFIPLIAYPYIGAFMASMSTSMVRVFTGFHSEHPPKGHDSNFYGFSPIIYGLVLVFCAVFSYIIVNKGLEAFESVYVAPLFKIAGMITNLTTGGYMLGEFSSYKNKTHFILFLMGCGICMMGVMLLVVGNHNNEKRQKKELTEKKKERDPQEAPMDYSISESDRGD